MNSEQIFNIQDINDIITDYKKQFEETFEITIIRTNGEIKKINVSYMDNELEKYLDEINGSYISYESGFSWKNNERIDIYMSDNPKNLKENKLINYLLNKCNDEYNQYYKRWYGKICLYGDVIITKHIFCCDGCGVERGDSKEMCDECKMFYGDESESDD